MLSGVNPADHRRLSRRSSNHRELVLSTNPALVGRSQTQLLEVEPQLADVLIDLGDGQPAVEGRRKVPRSSEDGGVSRDDLATAGAEDAAHAVAFGTRTHGSASVSGTLVSEVARSVRSRLAAHTGLVGEADHLEDAE